MPGTKKRAGFIQAFPVQIAELADYELFRGDRRVGHPAILQKQFLLDMISRTVSVK